MMRGIDVAFLYRASLFQLYLDLTRPHTIVKCAPTRDIFEVYLTPQAVETASTRPPVPSWSTAARCPRSRIAAWLSFMQAGSVWEMANQLGVSRRIGERWQWSGTASSSTLLALP